MKKTIILLFFFPFITTAQTCHETFGGAFDGEEYIKTIEKTIYVNFHFIRDENGEKNFDETEGDIFVQNIVNNVNYLLSKNEVDNLPIGELGKNLRPKIKIQIQAQLNDTDDPDQDGIYYWESATEWARLKNPGEINLGFGRPQFYSSDRMNGFEKENVVNIFFLERYGDWFTISNQEMPSGVAEGYGEGDGVIVYGSYYEYLQDPGVLDGWDGISQNVIHEMGHLFGLHHDTRPYGSYNPKDWCGTGGSNNYMQYGCLSNSFTAHQIFKMHSIIKDKDYLLNDKFGFNDFAITPVPIDSETVVIDNVKYLQLSTHIYYPGVEHYWKLDMCDDGDCTEKFFSNDKVLVPVDNHTISASLFLRTISAKQFFKINEVTYNFDHINEVGIKYLSLLDNVYLNNIPITSLPIQNKSGTNYYIDYEFNVNVDFNTQHNISVAEKTHSCDSQMDLSFAHDREIPFFYYRHYNNAQDNFVGYNLDNSRTDNQFILNKDNGNAAAFWFHMYAAGTYLGEIQVNFIGTNCADFMHTKFNQTAVDTTLENELQNVFLGEHTITHVMKEGTSELYNYETTTVYRNPTVTYSDQSNTINLTGNVTYHSLIYNSECMSSSYFGLTKDNCDLPVFTVFANNQSYEVYGTYDLKTILLCDNEPTVLKIGVNSGISIEKAYLLDEGNSVNYNLIISNNSVTIPTSLSGNINKLRVELSYDNCSDYEITFPVSTVNCIDQENACSVSLFPVPLDDMLTIKDFTDGHSQITKELKQIQIVDPFYSYVYDYTLTNQRKSVVLKNLDQLVRNKLYTVIVTDVDDNTCVKNVFTQ
ncbi:MAG: hypothetical protein MRY83_03535 [Flavobacteriales bacterium]|nr:hypothetical protein [Flavobacteriales bacterium]